MTLRLLNADDAVWVLPLVRDYFPTHPTEEQVRSWFTTSTPHVAFGDPDGQHEFGDGIVGLLLYERLDDGWAQGETAAVRQALLPLRNRSSTQVFLLAPLPFGMPGGPAFILNTMLPLLRRVIREMRLRSSSFAFAPIWAILPLPILTFMRDGAGSLAAPFPNTVIVPLSGGANGIGYIPRLRDADT